MIAVADEVVIVLVTVTECDMMFDFKQFEHLKAAVKVVKIEKVFCGEKDLAFRGWAHYTRGTRSGSVYIRRDEKKQISPTSSGVLKGCSSVGEVIAKLAKVFKR